MHVTPVTIAWLLLATVTLTVGIAMSFGAAAAVRRVGYTPFSLALVGLGAVAQALFRDVWPLQLAALLVPAGALLAWRSARRAQRRKEL